jgi:LysM repeat protein
MHHRPSLTPARIAALIALLAVGSFALPTAATDRVVVVESGDTLSAIALRHGVTLARLLALNTIADPNRIYPGQRLRLAEEPAATPTPVAVQPAAIVHLVRAGEHLTGIAQRYGSSIAAIARANKLANPSYLRVGQSLWIPGTTAPPAASTTPAAAAPAAATQVHTVAAGETLSGIAQRYRTTIAAIAKANAITNPSYLRVGQRLTIRGTARYSTPRMSSTMSVLVAARGEIGAIVAAEATAQGVPLAFALAVAWQESGWRDDVISPAGAVGVMQLTPPTADWVAGTMLHASIDLHDARSNVRAGVRLLRHYLARYGGDKALVLAAYYQGQTAADRHGVYAISQSYIASVLALESLFAR